MLINTYEIVKMKLNLTPKLNIYISALLFYMKNIIYTILKDNASLISPEVPIRSNECEQSGIFDACQHS